MGRKHTHTLHDNPYYFMWTNGLERFLTGCQHVQRSGLRHRIRFRRAAVHPLDYPQLLLHLLLDHGACQLCRTILHVLVSQRFKCVNSQISNINIKCQTSIIKFPTRVFWKRSLNLDYQLPTLFIKKGQMSIFKAKTN